MIRKSPDPARRDALKAFALGALAFELGGVTRLLSPREARAQAVPLTLLSEEEARIVGALGRAIVPGADQAGLAHYLDHQLSAKASESFLMLRYLEVPPPYADFYRPALASADRLAVARFAKPLPELSDTEASGLVSILANGNPEGWQGPPAPFFYFVFRADAVDAVYGTTEGFEKLNLAYLAHIEPPTAW